VFKVYIKFILIVCFSMFIAACGEEEPGEMKLSLDKESIQLSGSPDGNVDSKDINITIINSNAVVHLKAFKENGSAADTMEFNWDGSYITVSNPFGVSVGTYEEQITIQACKDRDCEENILGSPAYVDVTFISSDI